MTKFKVKGLRGLCPDALSGSRFSDLKVRATETWKTLIQILVSILTAIGTTLGVTSCMGYGPIAML